MPLLGFKKEFVEQVVSGKKRQTIRAMRKRSFQEGDILYMYTGLRTKHCKKLFERKCLSVMNIRMYKNGDVSFFISGNLDTVLSIKEKESLAKRDGFKSFDKMYQFFEKNHGFPFCGQIIGWGKK